MDAKLDTLATSRKLKETGMPAPQAEAVIEIVNDAMTDLVTKEYLTVELGRSFNEFERKLDKRFAKVDAKFDKVDERFDKVNEKFVKLDAGINDLKLSIAELGKSQAWGFVSIFGITIAAGALLFTALQFFGF